MLAISLEAGRRFEHVSRTMSPALFDVLPFIGRGQMVETFVSAKSGVVTTKAQKVPIP